MWVTIILLTLDILLLIGVEAYVLRFNRIAKMLKGDLTFAKVETKDKVYYGWVDARSLESIRTGFAQAGTVVRVKTRTCEVVIRFTELKVITVVESIHEIMRRA